MSFVILGLGTALPPNRSTRAEALAVCQAICCQSDEQASWLPDIYANLGIETRHSAFDRQVMLDVLHGTRVSQSVFLPDGRGGRGPTTGQRMRHYADHVGPLALEASRRALDDSGLPPRALTHVVTVSCTGFAAPGMDATLIEGLGLPMTVERTHVGFMGCHGALNGLRVARAFATAQPRARVLVCAAELCVLHYYYGWDPQKVVANALFADGAAAVIGGADGTADAWRVAASGSCLFPGCADAMTWTIGDHGFEMSLSKHVPQLIAANLRPWVERWLADCGFSLPEIASWAIHPGGPRILSAAAEALGLRAEATAASRAVFAECGNMSSPTVLFILDRLRRQRAPRPCVALGFGPGLAAEIALFR